MRLDRFLSSSGLGTRKHVKKAIRSGAVFIDDKPVKDDGFIFDPSAHKVVYKGKIIPYEEAVYILMNKPVGYLCSTIDELYPSVLNLLEEPLRKRARIVGRLDVDTTGVLLITDNGKFNNRLIHPKTKVEKEYEAVIDHPLSQADIKTILEDGVQLDEETLVKPLSLKEEEPGKMLIVVREGKYHEIKRIFHRFGSEVMSLDRVRLGFLTCEGLEKGSYRRLDEDEVLRIKELVGFKEQNDEAL